MQPNFEPILLRDSEVDRIEVYARGAGVYADLAKNNMTTMTTGRRERLDQ